MPKKIWLIKITAHFYLEMKEILHIIGFYKERVISIAKTKNKYKTLI